MENIVIKLVKENEFVKILKTENGWWFENGLIVVLDNNSKVENSKVIVHEFVEYLLENEFGVCHEIACEIAKVFEKEFVTILELVGEGCKSEIIADETAKFGIK